MKNNAQILPTLFILLTLWAAQAPAQETTEKKILWTSDWSPNGKYIAVGGDLDSLNLYSAKDLKRHKSYPIKGMVTCVKWHPYKNILAVAVQASDETTRLINLDTDEVIPLKGISPDGARGMDWNYSGDFLAVGDNDGRISIFDASGKWIRTIQQENTKSITAVDWHPSQNFFITVGDKIRLFGLEGVLLKTIQHRPEGGLLLSVCWHPSGDFFVTGDYGDSEQNHKPLLQFWNTKGQLLQSIDQSIGEYRNITWNTKGTRLATASDALRICDKRGRLVSIGKSEDYLWGLSWNKQGTQIVTSSIAQRIVLWDHKARRKITKT